MFQFIKTSDIPSKQTFNYSFYSFIKYPNIISNNKKIFTAFAGIIFQLVIGAYLAIGNFIPYLASYLTLSQFNFQIDDCSPFIQQRYASNIAICNWLLTAFTVGLSIPFLHYLHIVCTILNEHI